jgi:hypothetical protein
MALTTTMVASFAPTTTPVSFSAQPTLLRATLWRTLRTTTRLPDDHIMAAGATFKEHNSNGRIYLSNSLLLQVQNSAE